MLAVCPQHYALRPDSTIGGEIYERELLARLPGHGVEVAIGAPGGRLETERVAGWHVDALPAWTAQHWALAPGGMVPWAVRRARAGAGLLRAGSVRFSGPSLLAARRVTGVPVVVHQHHLEPRWARLEAAICRAADLTITVSEASRRALGAHGVPGERVAVVHQGITDPRDVEAGCDALWPRPEALRVLFVGRLEPRKRADLAVAAVQRAGVDTSLVVAGEGDAPAADPARVRFLGRVDEARKWGLYDAADVLVFPSSLEGFGLVAAEAQSRGLPVVVADGAGSAEAIAPGRSGLAVAPTAEAFARALEDLADAERRLAMGDAARAHADRFSWETAARRVAKLYRELASSRGSTSSATRRTTASGR